MLIKVHLTKTAFTTTPAKAGKPFAASLPATESDTAAAVASGTITCKGIVGGAKLRATHSLRHGVVTCNWKLPKTSKGKLFHGTVTITTQGATLTKTFTAKVH